VVHPQAGDHLEDIEALLAGQESVGHRRQRAQLHTAGGQPHPVRGHPVDLGDEHPDHRRARGGLHPEQLLHTEAVDELIEQRRDVVHPGDEGRPLRPRPELGVLLDAGVQVADHGPGVGDRLPVELQHQSQHAMGRGVLRAHIDDQALVVEVRAAEHRVPVAAGDVVDPSLGGLAGR
jgi:hypothetical protein